MRRYYFFIIGAVLLYKAKRRERFGPYLHKYLHEQETASHKIYFALHSRGGIIWPFMAMLQYKADTIELVKNFNQEREMIMALSTAKKIQTCSVQICEHRR